MGDGFCYGIDKVGTAPWSAKDDAGLKLNDGPTCSSLNTCGVIFVYCLTDRSFAIHFHDGAHY
jgi:hypothetical protein